MDYAVVVGDTSMESTSIQRDEFYAFNPPTEQLGPPIQHGFENGLHDTSNHGTCPLDWSSILVKMVRGDQFGVEFHQHGWFVNTVNINGNFTAMGIRP